MYLFKVVVPELYVFVVVAIVWFWVDAEVCLEEMNYRSMYQLILILNKQQLHRLKGHLEYWITVRFFTKAQAPDITFSL